DLLAAIGVGPEAEAVVAMTELGEFRGRDVNARRLQLTNARRRQKPHALVLAFAQQEGHPVGDGGAWRVDSPGCRCANRPVLAALALVAMCRVGGCRILLGGQ